jgi:hypothetical protein
VAFWECMGQDHVYRSSRKLVSGEGLDGGTDQPSLKKSMMEESAAIGGGRVPIGARG